VQGTPAKQVTAFDRAQKDKGVEHTITVYPGVGHAFVNAGNYNKSGTAQNARNRMLDFLKHTIGKTTGMM
jgi:dienelactone hydrolase